MIEARQPTPMPTSTRWILSAVALVVLIAGISVMASGQTQSLQGRAEVILSSTGEGPFDVSGLANTHPGFGTDQDIYTLNIRTKGGFTARYALLKFRLSGINIQPLLDPKQWALYLNSDYTQKVGEGAEVLVEGENVWVRFKLQDPTKSYAGFASLYDTTLSVTTTVERADSILAPDVVVDIGQNPPAGIGGWAVVPGIHSEAWTLVDKSTSLKIGA